MAYEVHCSITGRPMSWDDLSTLAQVAWNETAVVIQHAHRFMTQVEEPGVSSAAMLCANHEWSEPGLHGIVKCVHCDMTRTPERLCKHEWVCDPYKPDDIYCFHCGKIKGEVIEETVDGGGARMTSTGSSNIEKDGTG